MVHPTVIDIAVINEKFETILDEYSFLFDNNAIAIYSDQGAYKIHTYIKLKLIFTIGNDISKYNAVVNAICN